MGLLPQLMPSDVLVLHCPLCTYHSHLLNNIEEHFDEFHPDKMIDYFIYRCAICHKVASCRQFMDEHIALIHNKNSTTAEQQNLQDGSTTIAKSTSPDSTEVYGNMSYITIYFSGKLYSKSQKTNSFSSDISQIQQSPETRPCSRTNSDVLEHPATDGRQFKCIFCNTTQSSFHHLQIHYIRHGIRNLGESNLKESSMDHVADETNGSTLSDKTLNITDNDEQEERKDSETPRTEMNDQSSSGITSANTHMSVDFLSQSPLKSLNQISSSLQSRSSLFNLIMQSTQPTNQSPQSTTSEDKVSPPNIDSFCSVGLSLPFPISNKVPTINPRINGTNWFSGLSPGQLITSPILSSLHSQFGLPSLHQHMMNAYAAVNGNSSVISAANSGFSCSSPNPLYSGSTLLTNNPESSNSVNNANSPSNSNNDLFQVPKGFPSVFSSVMNVNGTNGNSVSMDNASIDLSANATKKIHDKTVSSSESDRSSLSLSPTEKYHHSNNRNHQDDHVSEPSSINGNGMIDGNNLEDSQVYSMKRVVGLSRTNLPFQARKILFGWLTSHLREPYPSEEEKIRLANETGLSRTTVNNWFINARRRYVKPLLQGKLGMTSGVLKSMLENNNGIIHNQRNQFPQNVISSGFKRKTLLNNNENDDSQIPKKRANTSSSGKGGNNIKMMSRESFAMENNVNVKIDCEAYGKGTTSVADCEFSEFSGDHDVFSDNILLLDSNLCDVLHRSDIKIEPHAKDHESNIIPLSSTCKSRLAALPNHSQSDESREIISNAEEGSVDV